MQSDEILWVHACKPGVGGLDTIAQALGVPETAVAEVATLHTSPALRHVGTWFAVDVVAVKDEAMPQFPGEALTALCGPNVVLTVAPGEAKFLDDVAAGTRGNPDVGALSAEGFLASLLDAHLTSYFQAASH